MTEREWQLVPMQTLRDWVREECHKDSQRGVAEFLGIGRTTLTHFIDGVGTPHPRIQRTIALAYLRAQNVVPRDDAAEMLERLEAARKRLVAMNEQDSVRMLASKVGLGSSTLHGFLEGADPQPRIRRKLLDWFASDVGAAPDRVQAALDVLLEGMPEKELDGARTDLLQALIGVSEARGVSLPRWAQVRNAEEDVPGSGT